MIVERRISAAMTMVVYTRTVRSGYPTSESRLGNNRTFDMNFSKTSINVENIKYSIYSYNYMPAGI
jgi:hypothetical protein